MLIAHSRCDGTSRYFSGIRGLEGTSAAAGFAVTDMAGEQPAKLSQLQEFRERS